MTSIVNGIVPVALLIAFGFMLGKRGAFGEDATRAFAKLVATIALPLDLFPAAIATPRSQLGNVAYDAALLIALLGLFVVTFLVRRNVLHNDQRERAIEGLTVGFPNMAFVALPILISAVGRTTGTLPVLVGNIVTSIVIVPAAMFLLNREALPVRVARCRLAGSCSTQSRPPWSGFRFSESCWRSPTFTRCRSGSTRR